MATRTLDKMTKAELLAHIARLDAELAALRPRLEVANAEIRALRAEIEELNAQREDGEVIPYRARLRAWCRAHPHVLVRQTPDGAVTRDGNLVVRR